MGPAGLALVSLAIVFHNVLNVFGIPGGMNFGGNNIGGDVDVNNPKFDITMNFDTSKKPSKNEVVVSGRGVKDTFILKSTNTNYGGSSMTSIANEKYVVFNNPEQDLAFYSDTDNTLIVLMADKCTKRSYTTSGSKTAYTESKMRLSQCEEVKEKMKEAEEQWQKDFNEKMNKRFPPSSHPGNDESQEDKHKESSEDKSKSPEKDSSESADSSDSSSDEITETDKTSPEYWRQWQKKFDADMKKKFPPCFPFCDKEKQDKKKQGDKQKLGDKKKQGDKDKSKSSGSQSSNPSKPSKEDADEDDLDEWNF